MEELINIAIAEDITKLSEILKAKVELAKEFKVTLMASNGEDLLKQLEKNHNIDIILMDINMPVMDGVKATEEINKKWPQIKIIMCTVFDDEQNIFNAIMAGATGYLLKDESPAKVHKSIYEAIEGGAPMSPMIARKSLRLIRGGRPVQEASGEDYNLTKRELEILEQISKGLSYDQISVNLFISYGTTRKHIENIYRKLRVHSKIEAVDKARKGGII